MHISNIFKFCEAFTDDLLESESKREREREREREYKKNMLYKNV